MSTIKERGRVSRKTIAGRYTQPVHISIGRADDAFIVNLTGISLPWPFKLFLYFSLSEPADLLHPWIICMCG